jgi:hypothetical protein
MCFATSLVRVGSLEVLLRGSRSIAVIPLVTSDGIKNATLTGHHDAFRTHLTSYCVIAGRRAALRLARVLLLFLLTFTDPAFVAAGPSRRSTVRSPLCLCLRTLSSRPGVAFVRAACVPQPLFEGTLIAVASSVYTLS